MKITIKNQFHAKKLPKKTVWKLQNFSNTEILREIKVGEFRVDSTVWKSTIKRHSVENAGFFYHSDFRLNQLGRI